MKQAAAFFTRIMHALGFCQVEAIEPIGRTDRWRCTICGRVYLEDEEGLR